MNIERNDERILIKYVDSNFNTYKCVITTDDVFVVNFCRRDLSLLEDILKNNILVEMDDYYVLRIEKPIFLEYQLKKEKQEEITNLGLILEKFKILEEENKMLRDKVEKLEKHIELSLESIKNINKQHNESILQIQSQIGDSFYIPELDRFFPKNMKTMNIHSYDFNRYRELNTEYFKFEQFKNFTKLKYIYFRDIRHFEFLKFNLNSLKIFQTSISFNLFNFGKQFKQSIEEKIRIDFGNEFDARWVERDRIEIKRKN